MTRRPDLRAWLAASPAHLRPALEGCASGALPPNIALVRLAIEAKEPAELETVLAAACEGAGRHPRTRRGAERLRHALALWHDNPQAFALVKAVLDGIAHDGAAPDSEAGLAHWARAFDRMAAVSPEGSVALYALGNPGLLKAATDEVVARMGEWRLLGPGRRAVDLGCGIGRFVSALAPHLDAVIGLDISGAMIDRARERCADLPNVTLKRSSGRDLEGIPDGHVDLVLAADVFPYLVHAGGDLVDRHFLEAHRVLRRGGHLLILNYSYRGNLKQDRNDLAVLAARRNFALRRSASGDFALWDATTFLVERL